MSSSEYYRQYREENREVLRARARKWYQDNKEKELKRRRNRTFGLKEGEFDDLYKRQGGSCAISKIPFEKTPHVDHDHKTGKIRGLLSQEANCALGLFKDDPEALYRAAAYLTLDRSKKLIYVIGSLRSESVTSAANLLREAGFDAFDNWISAGPEADDYWKSYSKQKGLSFTEALNSREAQHVFRFDKAYLDLCDGAVLVLPAGKSGFMELGYIVGAGKPACILLDEETEKNRYDVMPQFASLITPDMEKIIEYFTNG